MSQKNTGNKIKDKNIEKEKDPSKKPKIKSKQDSIPSNISAPSSPNQDILS